MFKPVKFTPPNFGGFTFAMLLSGVFLGKISIHNDWVLNTLYLLLSVGLFLYGVNFYKKDNYPKVIVTG